MVQSFGQSCIVPGNRNQLALSIGACPDDCSCTQAEDEEEETDGLVNQVLDEIGIANLTEVRRLRTCARPVAVVGLVRAGHPQWSSG